MQAIVTCNISFELSMILFFEVQLSYDPWCRLLVEWVVGWSVSWLVCRSVGHNFLKRREVTLPCYYRSTYLLVCLNFIHDVVDNVFKHIYQKHFVDKINQMKLIDNQSSHFYIQSIPMHDFFPLSFLGPSSSPHPFGPYVILLPFCPSFWPCFILYSIKII